MTEVFGTPEFEAPAVTAIDAVLRTEAKHAEPRALSPFDALKEEASRDIDKFETFENTLRPGWFMKFRCVIDAPEIKRYQQHAQGPSKKRRNPEDADLIKGNAVMLGEKCVAIMHGGTSEEHIVVDSDGDELVFTSEEFVTLFADESGTVQSALQKFLGDAQLMKLAGAVLVEAGYDDDMQPVDPTNG